MIKPPSVVSGDLVSIVAPARKPDRESIEKATHILKTWGLQVKWGENLFSTEHSYFSATNEMRLRDFQAALDDKKVKAIFCARGGYGTTPILDHLDFSTFLHQPKWIVGFSDVTALHLHLYKQGINSIHGTMPLLFSKPEASQSLESLRKAIMHRAESITFYADGLNKPGGAVGQVIGGNLSLIVDSLATASEPDTRGCILVVEEVDEYFYKIDRMFTQLQRSGKLDGLSGLVVGHFTDIKETTLPFGETIHDIVLKHTKNYHYPVAFRLPVGHAEPNIAWVHGAMASLRVTPTTGSLIFGHEKSA
jgi:muramoyltetrapeptide carboxypeptidase